uniref:Uncharacterized protein n=1 Tax=Anopheles culicifacies TaxID=139723 RepID=A0A182M677_9DIPT
MARCRKLRGQYAQLNGFSFACIRRCCVRCDCCRKRFPHSTQPYGPLEQPEIGIFRLGVTGTGAGTGVARVATIRTRCDTVCGRVVQLLVGGGTTTRCTTGCSCTGTSTPTTTMEEIGHAVLLEGSGLVEPGRHSHRQYASFVEIMVQGRKARRRQHGALGSGVMPLCVVVQLGLGSLVPEATGRSWRSSTAASSTTVTSTGRYGLVAGLCR